MSRFLLIFSFFASFFYLIYQPVFAANSGLQLQVVSDNNTYSTDQENQFANFRLAIASPYLIPNGRFEILFAAASNQASSSDSLADYGSFDFGQATFSCPDSSSEFNFFSPVITTADQANIIYGQDYYHLLTCAYAGTGNQANFGFNNQNYFYVNQVINPKNDPEQNPHAYLFAPIWVRQIADNGTIIYHQKETVSMSRAVTMSATVTDQLTASLSGVAAGQTACGQLNQQTTTGNLANFGRVNSKSFVDLAQKLTVVSNSVSYVVTASQDDQLSLEDDYGQTSSCFGTGLSYDNCLPDATVADMSQTQSQSWTDINTGQGLAFTLENLVGDQAEFDYHDGYRHFADQQNGDEPATIIRQTTSGTNSHYLCYRLVATETNLPGFYHNNLIYTVTATF